MFQTRMSRRSPLKPRLLSRNTRPQPKFGPPKTPPAGSVSVPLRSDAFTRGAFAARAFAGSAVPVGYQPSWKNWRMSAAPPAVVGQAIDVPDRPLVPQLPSPWVALPEAEIVPW